MTPKVSAWAIVGPETARSEKSASSQCSLFGRYLLFLLSLLLSILSLFLIRAISNRLKALIRILVLRVVKKGVGRLTHPVDFVGGIEIDDLLVVLLI